jgi:hypothetical protein
MACLEYFVEQQRRCVGTVWISTLCSGSNLLERIKVDVIDCEHIQDLRFP